MASTIEMTDEQSMLLETASEFCRQHSPLDAVRRSIGMEESIDPALWQQMVDLGWLGVIVPAEHGGLGLGPGDLVPIAESMGRHLMSSPFFATIMATQAINGSGSEAQKADWLPRIVGGATGSVALTEADGSWMLTDISATGEIEGDKIRLGGTKTFVLDAQAADLLIASVNIDGKARLVLIEKDQVPTQAITRDIVIDETRRSFTLVLDGISVPATQLLPGADFRLLEQTALLLLSAEIAGGLAGVLHVIVDYLTTRKQFDKLIGSYQALKHPTVQILLSLEAARSHVYHAATALAGGNEEEISTALHMAKAQGSEAFAFAGDRAIQFHGGFGFTYECNAQLYLRRALWCQYQFGDERYHRSRLASLLLGETA
ncbi:MAG: acyl-CoA dehydrogenase family protein [Pseudomonadota bacterium]